MTTVADLKARALVSAIDVDGHTVRGVRAYIGTSVITVVYDPASGFNWSADGQAVNEQQMTAVLARLSHGPATPYLGPSPPSDAP